MVADDKTAIQLPKNIEIYQDSSRRSPFEKWRNKLKGNLGAPVDQALDRVKASETVKVKSYDGKVGAIILSWPRKLRIYYGLLADNTIVLMGGDEDAQNRDIDQAKLYWEDYISRGDKDG
jgi:putative addiction module killer protein